MIGKDAHAVISQQGLNHLYGIHQERMDALNLNSIAKEFDQANEKRIQLHSDSISPACLHVQSNIVSKGDSYLK